eukprot:TRINITY_DN29524_c1_g1_i1.p1 TRINITY_DN29524_c1_g1~~TRINITY_DN29524_c1_g1_i1.p1  ORF type:complete len:683 (-),score=79.14 TRINITY_DN29524_c1_g1_i1:522-2300(-)
MDFSVLRKFLSRAPNNSSECQFALQGLHLVQAEYLRRSGRFLPPPETASACWDSYQALFGEFTPNFDIRSACGFETQWISDGCMNITKRSEFEAVVPENSMVDVRRACDQSLENNSPCATCITSLSRIGSSYLTGREVGNVTDCATYPFIYAAGVVNSLEPADDRSAVCLFLLGAASSGSNGGISKGLIWGVVVSCIVALGALVIGVWFLCRKNRKLRTFLWRKKNFGRIGNSRISQLGSLGHASTTLIRFTFEEIKEATRNFSNDNIIGRGGYGNVYRGILSNGLEVAMKRFKNCSAAGDASFTHEVEVIASVRHVNLVALRGYCVATTRFEGHQRIIICDLMRNGSLHDHLFGLSGKKLSWPIRQKIAIGMARGLAYLHYGAQPAIMHRDIKASNILLDESFEPKVADFGLAKFTQEGMTHWSTRVAGTLGYVAPEYALYGQLTEKSDVYSFGVVLLELLSGKKALTSVGESQSWLVTDWAWSLVREGRVLDVIEDGMDELGPREVLERYVLVAILSSHPEMHARPTMDQVVKILETDYPLPSIPERPLPIVACIEDIEKSVSSNGSANLSSSSGYQPYIDVNTTNQSMC